MTDAFARWQYGALSYTLAQWQTNVGYDLPASSLTGDPQFVDAAQGNFQLQPGSPAKNRGRPDKNGVRLEMGAYATGTEVIGVIMGPRPNPPRNVVVN